MTEASSTHAESPLFPTWLDRLYPLWMWLILLPAVVLFTIIAAPVAILVCLFGGQRFANLRIAALWARLIARLTPVRVEIEGMENVEPGRSYVVVANHQSQYDIPVIYGYCGLDLRWVMKAEIGRIPFVAQGCRAIGHIFIDRSDPEQARAAINRAVADLPDGTGVLFFPEGTRSRSGELLRFRKGAFRVAIDRGLPVLPMTVTGTRDILEPGSFRVRPGRARLVIHPPIEPEPGVAPRGRAVRGSGGGRGRRKEALPDPATQRLSDRARVAIASALGPASGRSGDPGPAVARDERKQDAP
ncbi:lysophospholipid acyltransferase family protein [Halomonas denitrificans]|nr:1-acyl-sn-glycerol-3-phosphate acyltransferase [Halomonas denitrificans]